MVENNKFRFGIPIDIKKGKNDKGEDTFLFEGLAATPDVDSQNEQLLLDQFDLNEFNQVNYNHQGSRDANSVLGEILEHKFVKNGLFVKGELWKEQPMTQAVVNMINRYKKKGKKLQLSVEGQVIKRGHKDPKNPLYNKVLKAKLTGVAVTCNPINGRTYLDMVKKGFNDNDEWEYEKEDELIMKAFSEGKSLSDKEIDDLIAKSLKNEEATTCPKCDHDQLIKGTCLNCGYVEKAMTAENTNMLAPESVEGGLKKLNDSQDIEQGNKKFLSKSEIIDYILTYFCPVDNETVKNIYKTIEKSHILMEKKIVTKESLEKALQVLDLAIESKSENETKLKDDEIKKAVEDTVKIATEAKGFLETKEAVGAFLVKKGIDKDIIEKSVAIVFKEVAAEEKKNENFNNDILQKAFSEFTTSLSSSLKEKFGALGTLIKSQFESINSLVEQNEELKKSNETLNESITQIKSDVDKIGKATPGSKSKLMAEAVERFKKGVEDGKVFDLSTKSGKKQLSDYLDKKSGFDSKHTTNGEYNEEIFKASQEAELGAVSQRTLNLLKSEGIEVVNFIQ